MRTLFIALVGAVVLAFGCVAIEAGSNGKAEVNKQFARESQALEGKSVAEIEKLVSDLGHKDFRVREAAYKDLSDTPGALILSRAFINDKDAERKNRVRMLANELTEKNAKRLLKHIIARKEKAPLDLLTDLVVGHSERFSDGDWKAIFAAIATTKTHFLKNSKVKVSVPDPNQKYAKYPLLRADKLTARDLPLAQKIVGQRVEVGLLSDSAVFASGSVTGSGFGGSIILANGGIKMWDTACSLGDFVYCDEDIACETMKWTPKTGQSNKLLLAVQERGNHAKETEVPHGGGEGPGGAGGGEG